MDVEKLIKRLRSYTYWLGQDGPESHDIHSLICDESATALSTLQAENEKLKDQLYDGEGVNLVNYWMQQAKIEENGHRNCQAENEQLRAELEYEKEHANAYYEECGQWEAENTQLKEKLEALKQDRDAIEQDFRAFAKQWWEEDSGFPCRWCKFERQGGCEWKEKHREEENICAGRAFEWRGPKKGGLTMERLTEKRESGAWPKKGWTYETIAECLDRLAAIEDVLGNEYDLDELREMVQAKREGRCVVRPVGGYSDKDGETALKNAMFVCSLTNNAVNRYAADAIAEKLTRAEAEAALRREQE